MNWWNNFGIDAEEDTCSNCHQRTPIRKEKKNKLAINDVVIVHDETHKWHLWRMEKLIWLIISSDSVVKGAEVKAVEKNNRAPIISRASQKLYQLDVKDMNMSSSNQRSRINEGKTNGISKEAQ